MKKMILLVCVFGFAVMFASSAMSGDRGSPKRAPQWIPQEVKKGDLFVPKHIVSENEAVKQLNNMSLFLIVRAAKVIITSNWDQLMPSNRKTSGVAIGLSSV